MNNIPRFNSTLAASLQAFLDAPERSPDSMSYSEAAGFLFVVACAPELIPPSQWLPLIIDPDNAAETSLENMQAITEGLISLYNEMNRQVQEGDLKLPHGCKFEKDTMANLEPHTSISQWSSGFRDAYLWLEDMWSGYTPEELKEEFSYQVTVLCFFSNRKMASAFFDEVKNDELTLEDMAENMKRIFPDAMRGVAHLGHSIHEAMLARSGSAARPVVRGEKVGRNEPCTCGSGKKYKKCCGRTLH